MSEKSTRSWKHVHHSLFTQDVLTSGARIFLTTTQIVLTWLLWVKHRVGGLLLEPDPENS